MTESTIDPATPELPSLAVRELMAVREIAHAFLVAERPSDVFQFALDRVTPLLGATFSMVMQLGADRELLRPVAQHQWPARHRNWIGALRVRVGDGPSGLAVAERRIVEIDDLFADPKLVEWHEVAEELGFRSILAAPLLGASEALGAIAFYFADATRVTEEQRALVRLVADQLAATAEKATAMDALRRANAALAEANDTLERQAVEAQESRTARDRFMDSLTAQLETSLRNEEGGEPRTSADALLAAQAISRAARELTQAGVGGLPFEVQDVDARTPLLEAVQRWRTRERALPILVGEPTAQLPEMRTDRAWLQRTLELVIGHAVWHSSGHDAVVRADIELGRGFVAYRVRWREREDGASDDRAPLRHPAMTAFDLPLALALAARLGGELQLGDPPDGSGEHGMSLVLPLEATA